MVGQDRSVPVSLAPCGDRRAKARGVGNEGSEGLEETFEAVHQAWGRCKTFEPGWGSSETFEPLLVRDPFPVKVVEELLAEV